MRGHVLGSITDNDNYSGVSVDNKHAINSPATAFPRSVISNPFSLAAKLSFALRFLNMYIPTIMITTTTKAPAPASPPISGQLVVVSGTMN